MPVNDTEEPRACDSCGWESTDLDRFVIVDDSFACEDCYAYCDRHEDYVWSNDTRYIHNEGTWCESCACEYATWCEGCENYYSDRVAFSLINDMGEYRCEGCCEDFPYCEDCDSYFSDECGDCGATLDNDCTREPSNARNSQRTSRYINNYSYKPEPKFFGEDKHGLFFGIELETEIRSGNLRDSAQLVHDSIGNLSYMKEDASIGRGGYRGFELVTHPISFSYWQNSMGSMWDTLDTLRTKYEARSWDAESCGIHIHVSRAGFKSGAHTHRWLTLIYRNAQEMMKFAGRKSHYARFDDVWNQDEWGIPKFSVMPKLTYNRNTERYSAVNTQNEHTLELRFFRGTTRPSGVLSAVELAHASIEYTRDMTLSDVKLGMLGWEWFYDYVESNNGYYPNLYERMSKVPRIGMESFREQINA